MNKELKTYLLEQCRDWMLKEEIKALRRSTLTEHGKTTTTKNALADKKIELFYGYSDEKTNKLVELGKEGLENTIANRILTDHRNEVLNYCQKCGELARTPKARQCRYCGNKWFDKTDMTMKIISEEHFKRMEMMCKTFHSKSKNDDLFKTEYVVSKQINHLIKTISRPNKSDFENIVKLIKDVEKTEHYDGSQWFDYKIHLNAILKENGYEFNII